MVVRKKRCRPMPVRKKRSRAGLRGLRDGDRPARHSGRRSAMRHTRPRSVMLRDGIGYEEFRRRGEVGLCEGSGEVRREIVFQSLKA